jgi:hypothetical protein
MKHRVSPGAVCYNCGIDGAWSYKRRAGMDRKNRAKFVDQELHRLGLGRPTQHELPAGRQSAWRVSPDPFAITGEQRNQINSLGSLLHRFYRAADKLYHLGLEDAAYAFVVDYLDAGKPQHVIDISRHRSFKGQIPLILRPDLLWTPAGFVATEFDSIPGGAGLLAGMEEIYEDLGYSFPGEGTLKAFAESLLSLHRQDLLAIVVSEESSGYRAEMQYLAQKLSALGVPAVCLRPEEVSFRAGAVHYREKRIGTIYRFFELFDLDNIPGGLELLRAACRQEVKMTPPPKAYLEEKMWFGLLRHHGLRSFWDKAIGSKFYHNLLGVIPNTHILDNRPLPPHGVIQGLKINGQEVSSYLELSNLPRSMRQFVIKPSGFSPESWGSRGVTLGREISTRAWGEVLTNSLSHFPQGPYLLQEYHYSELNDVEYYDFEEDRLSLFAGKVRICPYYFTGDGNRILSGGVLVTACPADKPLIHGMTDAVMGPGS